MSAYLESGADHRNRAWWANKRAREYGVEGRITTSDVRAILHAEAVCAYCGTAERLTIDHIVGMHAGGMNLPINLQAACLSCNTSKARGPSPDAWSQLHDACTECGTTDHPHHGNGVCNSCRQKHWRARRSEQYLAYTRRRQRERYAARKLRAAATRRQGAA